MKRLALFALVLLAASEVEARDRRCRQNRLSRTLDCDSYAFFEAFPQSGAGLTSACSTTAPTGAKGEVLTFARTGSATCTKTTSGVFATTGIANGDLVTLSSGVARVEYDSDGILSLLVEPTRTNLMLRSQELDNAAWTKDSLNVAAPTVTANAAVAPDGTTTAERLQIPATTTSDFSRVFQAATAAPGTTATGSIYIKGNGTSGTVDMWVGSTPVCQACTYVADSWTRCSKATGNREYLVIGNSSSSCLVARGAQDIFVWGGQLEDGAYASSYVPTTAATVKREADAPYFTVASTEVQCLSAVIQAPATLVSNARVLGAATGAANTLSGYATGPGTTALHALQFVNPSSKDFTSSVNVAISTTQRVSVWVNPSVQLGASVAGVESTTTTGVLTAVTGVTKVYPGCYEGGVGFELGGHISRIQADPVFTRCTR